MKAFISDSTGLHEVLSMSDMEPLLTENDAAKFLNTSPGTLRNWRCKGKGPPYVSVGAAVRYAPDALRQYVEVRTRHAAGARGNAA